MLCPQESWPLWEFALNMYAAQRADMLETLMERACRNVSARVCLPAKEWSLHWTFRQGGLKSVRNVYKSLGKMRPASLGFYQIYIRIETAQVEPDLKRLRSAFEEALLEFGTSEPDVWLNYIQMEREIARSDSMGGVVYQRACQSLKPELRETFIRKHALLDVAAQRAVVA
ncbi:U3 small nucleolar RNA-associated protein 6-like protein [Plakobranchus ocellatus]|uniref:U3 small nucleolar RNA-associated protein 6-like protein n=1 Tax=Plakobranchus ocellatus TaxID=259542 RepID=A0AAV3ZR28_9GAST|nr:U3 small nucleolar RNA-associated protein 6-like protein [Plakobranchus ocellatus]